MIHRITFALIRHYKDTGTNIATIRWTDQNGQPGTTKGNPINLHIAELITKAESQGITVRREDFE